MARLWHSHDCAGKWTCIVFLAHLSICMVLGRVDALCSGLKTHAAMLCLCAVLDGSGVFSAASSSSSPPQTISLDDDAALAIFVLSLVFVLLVTVSFVYFAAKYERPVIQSINFSFLLTFYVGLVLVAISMVVWSIDQTDFTCLAKYFLAIFGYSLYVGACIGKLCMYFAECHEDATAMARLKPRYTLFSTARHPIVITREDVVIFGTVTALAVLNSLFYIFTVFITGEPKPTLLTTGCQLSTMLNYSYIECQLFNTTYQTVMLILIFSTNGIILLASCVLSIRLSYKLKVKFHFNLSVMAVLCMTFLLSVIVVPIYYFGEAQTESCNVLMNKFLLRSITTLSLLLFSYACVTVPALSALVHEDASQRAEPDGEAADKTEQDSLVEGRPSSSKDK